MKKKLISIFAVVFALTVFTGSVSAHWDNAYWNETDRAQCRTGWLNSVSNDRKLSEVSLPGTQVSMAYNSNLVHGVRTQAMNLFHQLQSGVRVFDIRLKHEAGYKLLCYNGPVYLGYNLRDVFDELNQFLYDNPTEFVVLRLDQEHSNSSDEDFAQTFRKYYYPTYQQRIYNGGKQNPTVGELRGKILLTSSNKGIAQYGVSYQSINKQDSNYLGSNWDLYSKWEKIKNQFTNSNNGRNSGTTYMNYITGYGGAMPYFVASGHSSPGTGAARLATGLTEPGFHNYYPDFPRVNWFLCFATIAYEGTNTLTANYLNNNKIQNAGMVMADFPGERLINAIIACNSR